MRDILRVLTLVAALLTTVTVTVAQTNKSEELPTFHTVDVSGNIHLILAPSSTETPTINYEEYGEQAAKLSYEVKKEVLYITLKTGLIDKDNSARVIVSNSAVNSIISQGAMVETLSAVTVDEFSYHSNGSKNIARLTLDCKSATVKASGYCDVLVKGRTHEITLSAASGGRIDALEMLYTEMEAKATLGSEIYIKSQGNISELTASTTGTIYYFGSDTNIRAKSSFGGAVVQINSTISSSPLVNLWDSENLSVKQLDSTKPQKKDKDKTGEKEVKDSVERVVEVERVKQEVVTVSDDDFF